MTSERDALLAAICATPEDDTPRLVFADWLDENGSAKWAELIRVECELARLADDGSGAEAMFRFLSHADEGAIRSVDWPVVDSEIARRVELSIRATLLRGKAKSQMACVRPKRCGIRWSYDDTHRGFPTNFSVDDPHRFIKALPVLLKTCPPNSNLGDALIHDDVDRLIAAGFLRWVGGLSLTSFSLEEGTAYSQSRDTAGLRTLELSVRNAEAPTVIRWLTISGNWIGLRCLKLSLYPDDPLSSDAVGQLLQAKQIHKLRCLRLIGTRWNENTIREINNFTEVRDLELHYCELGDDAAIALANMPGLANLRSLSLHNNRISGRGATALLTSPHLANLGFLDLENNPVRGLDAKALAAAPPGGLRGVGFHGCRLTIKDVAALAAAPRLTNLVYLDLDHNNLADSAVSGLVKGLGDHAPAILYLMGNRFGAKAAEALSRWPAATRIQRLHLYGNPIDISAARSLAGSPHLANVKYISTSGVPIAGKNILKKRFGEKVRL